MKHGDFTQLAKKYVHRPGYSLDALRMISAYCQNGKGNIVVADVGAGTGKLTENLIEIGLRGFAVEPNDEMRNEGMRELSGRTAFEWRKGSAEETGLADSSVDWVLMGSSFHWPDTQKALAEFQRILRPGGHFTAVWNPRDIVRSPLEQKVELFVKDLIPDIKRRSSGNSEFTSRLNDTLAGSGRFHSVVYLEALHSVSMTPERYIGVWESVNDIRVQAGEAGFQKLMNFIREQLHSVKEMQAFYKTRAWTATVQK